MILLMYALAGTVRLVHLLVVAFVLFGPLSRNPSVWMIHAAMCTSMLFHWLMHDNTCCLSVAEASLRGVPHNYTFTHALIAPIYEVSESSMSTLCYALTLGALAASSYKLYTMPVSVFTLLGVARA